MKEDELIYMNKKENRAVIDALRPHFIFNVMNILRLMITKDSKKAHQMVYDLSLYLRGRMETLVCEEWISIRDEMNYAQAYLRLEEIAHPNLEFYFTEVDGDFKVPVGCIQELTEGLVKDYVRVTKEKRTLILKSNESLENAELWICIPELDITERINTKEKEKSDTSFSK